MTINHDLLKGLTTWARQRKILPREFECPNYAKCNGPRGSRPPLDRGNTCLMSYVGREYGEPVSGKAFRLAIVGLDHGNGKYGGHDFAERQQGIEESYYDDRQVFNPHYKGVIRTAAAILGEAGHYCLANCWKEGRKSRCAGDARDGKRCALRSFAQPNLVKCVSAENMTCRATPDMFRLCSRHLVHELGSLRPDVAVFHGAAARWAFRCAVQDEGHRLAPVLEGPEAGDFSVIQELTGAGWRCFVVFLAHPSLGHLDRQWERVVEPALKWLRSERVIPPNSNS